jgi:hypothetical protein
MPPVSTSDSTAIRPSQYPSNIGLASIFIRLLTQSDVLAIPLIQKLDILRVMQATREAVWPSHIFRDTVPDNLIALKRAIAVIQSVVESSLTLKLDPLMRFGPGKDEYGEKTLLLWLEQLNLARCAIYYFTMINADDVCIVLQEPLTTGFSRRYHLRKP